MTPAAVADGERTGPHGGRVAAPRSVAADTQVSNFTGWRAAHCRRSGVGGCWRAWPAVARRFACSARSGRGASIREEVRPVSDVIMEMSMSLDGCIVGPATAKGAQQGAGLSLNDIQRRAAGEIARRRTDLVDLLLDLIHFDTTTRESIASPPREERALQHYLASRLGAAGLEVDLWEPSPADVVGHPMIAAGAQLAKGPPAACRRAPGPRWRPIAHVQRAC